MFGDCLVICKSSNTVWDNAEEAKGHMQHDDVIGEEVSEAEAQAVQVQIMFGILGPQALDSQLRFPGSQPVSLAASNMHLLAKHRYWVTWKADGTRYMLYLSPMGTYLVDRSFSVRRVQMRWPTAAPHTSLKYDPAKPHHSTLLDGEMVVDEDKVTKTQKRRYLAYDLMMLNGQALRRRDWKVSSFPCLHMKSSLAELAMCCTPDCSQVSQSASCI